MKKYMSILTDIAKLVSFISLVMSVVIKTRILLGINDKLNDEDKNDD
jgi:hypothetical protein